MVVSKMLEEDRSFLIWRRGAENYAQEWAKGQRLPMAVRLLMTLIFAASAFYMYDQSEKQNHKIDPQNHEIDRQMLEFLALNEAYKSDSIRDIPGQFVKSTKLAVQSIYHKPTGEGNHTLLEGLKLLPLPLAQKAFGGTIYDQEIFFIASKALAFSPDGAKIAAGSSDKTARVWDAVTGKELTGMVHDGAVRSVAFSPDGARIAAACDDGTATVTVVPVRSVDPVC